MPSLRNVFIIDGIPQYIYRLAHVLCKFLYEMKSLANL